MSVEQDVAAARRAVDALCGARAQAVDDAFAVVYGDGDDDGMGGSGRSAS
jgi:hypothetical protein